MIKKNNKNIVAVYKGTTEIASIYKGTDLLFNSNGGLPNGYTRLNYIHNEYTGGSGAYIRLNLQPTGSSILEIKCSTTQASSQFMVCVIATGSSGNYRIVKFTSGNRAGASIGSTNYTSQHNASTPVTIKIDHKKVYANGELIGDGTENQLGIYTAIDIMRGYYSATAIYYSTGKIYNAYVSVDGINPSFNGIPAKRNSDNVVGLYDTVTNTFFVSNNSNIGFEAGTIYGENE